MRVRPADPTSPRPHRHCRGCDLPAQLSLVAVLDVLYAYERELCDRCITEIRASGAIVDFIRELDDVANEAAA